MLLTLPKLGHAAKKITIDIPGKSELSLFSTRKKHLGTFFKGRTKWPQLLAE